MEVILNDVFLALKYLIVSGVIFFIYAKTAENTNKHNYKKIIWQGLLACLIISAIGAYTLGHFSCEEYEHDGMGSHCISPANDGFVPSTTERIGRFLFSIMFIYPPVFIGALKGRHNE